MLANQTGVDVYSPANVHRVAPPAARVYSPVNKTTHMRTCNSTSHKKLVRTIVNIDADQSQLFREI